MANDKIELLCNNCGQVFYKFLKDMAAHNERLVCPHCGKLYGPDEELGIAKATPPARTTPQQ